jgi:ATP-dependent Clp protease ATP-binding subunit ClpA
MTKRPPVTLEEVGEAIIALRKSGKETSVRNIRRITGGNNTTIMKLRAEWFEQELNEKAAPEINEEMLKNLKIGIGKAIRAENEGLSQRLVTAQTQRAEAVDLLDEVESDMHAAEETAHADIKTLNEEKQALQVVSKDTEKQLESAKQVMKELKKDNMELNKEILRLSKEAAAAQASSDLLERQNQQLLSGSLVESVVRKVMNEQS